MKKDKTIDVLGGFIIGMVLTFLIHIFACPCSTINPTKDWKNYRDSIKIKEAK